MIYTRGVNFTSVVRMTDQIHTKARSAIYPNSTQRRSVVPDKKVDWKVDFKEYNPVKYTAPAVEKLPVWADPDFSDPNINTKPNYNAVDGPVNRVSFTGKYKINKENLPLNPCGRTGLIGRGLLGKWGPNHAADPIVTRWKRHNSNIVKHPVTNKPVIQFVAIQRNDSKEWAIPGGMVDANERVSATLKREFGEEALNSLEATPAVRKSVEKEIKILFKAGTLIYKGYVDDPRNTDNAWMETVAVNFHDNSGESVGKLPLNAGDDAGAVKWMDINRELNLYANHTTFLEKTAENLCAHW